MIGHRISGVRFWPLLKLSVATGRIAPDGRPSNWRESNLRTTVWVFNFSPVFNPCFEREQMDRLSSETIVHVLADSEDRPWPERLSLTKAQLARLLAPFGIRPTIVNRDIP